MKSILILILTSLLTSIDYSNANNKDNFIGVWSLSISATEASNMEVCHRFIFKLSEEGKGHLSIELSLPNDPNNFDLFIARIPFDYEIIEDESNEYTRQIEVQYDNVTFNQLQNNRRKQYAFPVAFADYVKELERNLSKLKASYLLNLDGHDHLVIEGFSLVKNSTFANFKRGGGVASCNDLK